MSRHFTEQAPPRSDGRRQRTRSALLGAGQRLFAARAMEGVTIDEIVAEADVAKGSFYNHFDDKAGLASAIVELVQGDCEFHIFAANRPIADPALRVVRAMCVMIAYATEHPDRLSAMASLTDRRTDASAPLNVGVVADLSDGFASGRFTGIGLDAGLLIVVAVIRTLVADIIAGHAAAARARLALETGTGLLRALGIAGNEAARLARDAAEDLLETRS